MGDNIALGIIGTSGKGCARTVTQVNTELREIANNKLSPSLLEVVERCGVRQQLCNDYHKAPTGSLPRLTHAEPSRTSVNQSMATDGDDLVDGLLPLPRTDRKRKTDATTALVEVETMKTALKKQKLVADYAWRKEKLQLQIEADERCAARVVQMEDRRAAREEAAQQNQRQFLLDLVKIMSGGAAVPAPPRDSP